MIKSKFTQVVLLLTILLFTNGLAFAEQYTGCIKRFGGLLYKVKVGTEPKFPCGHRETEITWNQEGPQGEQGDQGEPGANGIDGVLLGKGASAEEINTADGEIYNTTSEPVQSTSGSVWAIAYCVDNNDIAIAGQCFGNPNWSLNRAGIGSNADSDNRARQICVWDKPASDETSAGAQVGCIKVPGP